MRLSPHGVIVKNDLKPYNFNVIYIHIGYIKNNLNKILLNYEVMICLSEEKNKKKTQYVLKDHMFSLSGFSKWFDDADTSNLKLITLQDLYKT